MLRNRYSILVFKKSHYIHNFFLLSFWKKKLSRKWLTKHVLLTCRFIFKELHFQFRETAKHFVENLLCHLLSEWITRSRRKIPPIDGGQRRIGQWEILPDLSGWAAQRSTGRSRRADGFGEQRTSRKKPRLRIAEKASCRRPASCSTFTSKLTRFANTKNNYLVVKASVFISDHRE